MIIAIAIAIGVVWIAIALLGEWARARNEKEDRM